MPVCDTDFVGTDGPGGGKFGDAEALAEAVSAASGRPVGSSPSPQPSPRGEREQKAQPSPQEKRELWGPFSPPGEGQDEGGRPLAKPYVVCTGGEPLLQLDAPLIAALQARGFEVAIETNGTLTPPPGIDWIALARRPTRRLCSPRATN